MPRTLLCPFSYTVLTKTHFGGVILLIDIPYDRARAVDYARRWALSRNPLFTDFTGIGGNCTNFVSQCILAGAPIMNYTKTYGWYYISESERAPAWSSVESLYNFLVGVPEFAEANGGVGPFALLARNMRQIEIGDVVQLANSTGDFYHTLIISGFDGGDVLVCAQSDDALDRPLSTYNYASLRVLHIMGARIDIPTERVFENLINAVSLPPDPLLSDNMQ